MTPVDGIVPGVPVRKRGRPPKVGSTPGKKRGRPPKSPVKNIQSTNAEKRDEIRNGSLKGSHSPNNDYSEPFSVQKVNYSDTGAVVSEKRRRGRPKKAERPNLIGKWSDGIAPSTGRYTLPLPVPDSWPIVFNMEEIMKELSEMYANVKEQKRGEFHNQIKAFVFALHWFSLVPAGGVEELKT
ncbi:unnamed protein product [Angiostrongylus costaricensis]|uniref:AT hook, DNA-binding motif-containing protein n=1 Tax=Angiostrongylus costaricensis TaxID=334426 RepID=A0A0R3PWC1_ANGCS|nr:unnamed protein product [Angiostrongylus costaricensis]